LQVSRLLYAHERPSIQASLRNELSLCIAIGSPGLARWRAFSGHDLIPSIELKPGGIQFHSGPSAAMYDIRIVNDLRASILNVQTGSLFTEMNALLLTSKEDWKKPDTA